MSPSRSFLFLIGGPVILLQLPLPRLFTASYFPSPFLLQTDAIKPSGAAQDAGKFTPEMLSIHYTPDKKTDTEINSEGTWESIKQAHLAAWEQPAASSATALLAAATPLPNNDEVDLTVKIRVPLLLRNGDAGVDSDSDSGDSITFDSGEATDAETELAATAKSGAPAAGTTPALHEGNIKTLEEAVAEEVSKLLAATGDRRAFPPPRDALLSDFKPENAQAKDHVKRERANRNGHSLLEEAVVIRLFNIRSTKALSKITGTVNIRLQVLFDLCLNGEPAPVSDSKAAPAIKIPSRYKDEAEKTEKFIEILNDKRGEGIHEYTFTDDDKERITDFISTYKLTKRHIEKANELFSRYIKELSVKKCVKRTLDELERLDEKLQTYWDNMINGYALLNFTPYELTSPCASASTSITVSANFMKGIQKCKKRILVFDKDDPREETVTVTHISTQFLSFDHILFLFQFPKLELVDDQKRAQRRS